MAYIIIIHKVSYYYPIYCCSDLPKPRKEGGGREEMGVMEEGGESVVVVVKKLHIF
jgi:hypothetical protein